MSFLKQVKNYSGFSLLEVMIVMVVMSILSANMITNTKNEDFAALRKQATNDRNEILNEIGTMLADPSICTTALQGTVLSVGNNIPIPEGQGIGSKYFAAPIATMPPPDNFLYRDYLGVPESRRYGNSRVTIHSLIVNSWIKPLAPLTNSTAILTVNFFRKNPNIWTSLNSMWAGKNINLAVNTDAASVVTSCVALNYLNTNFPAYPIDPGYPLNIANGIKACPTGMTMVGSSGTRSTFCIDANPRTADVYEQVRTNCTQIENPLFQLGSAHLCNYQEWSTACYQKNNSSMLTPAPLTIGTDWEWVSTSPSTSADDVTNPAIPLPSYLKIIGGPGVDQCATAKVNINPVSVDPLTTQQLVDANLWRGQTSDALTALNDQKTAFINDYISACQACQTAPSNAISWNTCTLKIGAGIANSIACSSVPGYTTTPNITCSTGTTTLAQQASCNNVSCYNSDINKSGTITSPATYYYTYKTSTTRCVADTTKNSARIGAYNSLYSSQDFTLTDDSGTAFTYTGTIDSAISQQEVFDQDAANYQANVQAEFDALSFQYPYRCCYSSY